MPSKTLQIDLKHLSFRQREGSLIFEHPQGYVIEFVQTLRSEESYGAIVTTMFWDGLPVLAVSHDRGSGNSCPEDGDWQWQWIGMAISADTEDLLPFSVPSSFFEAFFLVDCDAREDIIRTIMNAMREQDKSLSQPPANPMEI